MDGSPCDDCVHQGVCDASCAAVNKLAQIYGEQKLADRRTIMRRLGRELGIRDAEPDQQMRRLGEKVIRRFPELAFIREYGIKVGYVLSHEPKGGAKIVYGDCRKVPEVYKAYLPYDFIITFYDRNSGRLSENQLKILMYHELRHIGIGQQGPRIEPHGIEDFENILAKHGLTWSKYGADVADIFDVAGGE